jgi:hypothetical protein
VTSVPRQVRHRGDRSGRSRAAALSLTPSPLHSSGVSASPGAVPEVVRGSPNRITDFMEQFQVAYLTAVAAAAGCVLSEPEIDEGIDVMATHLAVEHTFPPDHKARLEIQLKATHQFAGQSRTPFFSVDMRRDRWEYYRVQLPIIGKIVVIMNVPQLQSDWTRSSHKHLAIRHCAYWVNLANGPDSNAQRPLVRAPRTQVFDDVALCGIMARIGQGEAP